MALPKLVTPEFETVIPSTKEPIKFRPFLVKEEKVLYMALESGEPKDMKNAILSILDSCIITPDIDVNSFATFDVEYLFLKLRSKSVGEIIKVNLKHRNKTSCVHETEYKLNLDKIQVKFNDDHKDIVQLDNKIGVKMKMPSLDNVLSIQGDMNIDNIFELIKHSIVYVFDEENVYDDFTKEELQDFIENISQEQFNKIQSFFDTAPKLCEDITWTCKECNETETIRLEGLQSFFM
jgi:hypothetical protein